MEVQFVNQGFEVLTPLDRLSKVAETIELAGRACYQSELKMEDGTAMPFVSRLLEDEHESVFEHEVITIRFTTNRAVANALVRHRHCAFSQESTHYIDYLKKRYEKIDFINPVDLSENERSLYKGHIRSTMSLIEIVYQSIRDNDVYHNHFIRDMFPLGLKTNLVMTTNLRQWRWIMKLRTKFDHPQTQALMIDLLEWFKLQLPIFVSDIPMPTKPLGIR